MTDQNKTIHLPTGLTSPDLQARVTQDMSAYLEPTVHNQQTARVTSPAPWGHTAPPAWGTLNNSQGLENVTQCQQSTPGMYCDVDGKLVIS